MAVNTEKIELLGKGVYDTIPDVLTLQSIPTSSELEFVSSEDFSQTMLDSILPQAVQEKIDFRQLLEIDFNWICRALRILNYGPYFTTNLLICGACRSTSSGEYNVDIRTVECKPLPDKFVNDIVIPKEEFLDLNEDVHIKLLTIQEVINSRNDNLFVTNDKANLQLARLCYMITSIGNRKNLSPIEVHKIIESGKISSADYIILKNLSADLTDYGLRAAGRCVCPKCGENEAAFIALVDDKFFRPTLGDLRRWRSDRSAGKDEKSS